MSIGDVCNDSDGNIDLSGSCTMDIMDANAGEPVDSVGASSSTSSPSISEHLLANSTTAALRRQSLVQPAADAHSSAIQSLIKAAPTTVLPLNLAETLALGSGVAQSQREELITRLKGKVVQWRLLIHDVTGSNGSGGKDQLQIITVADKKDSGTGIYHLGTIDYVTPLSYQNATIINGLQSGDYVTIKGVISNVVMGTVILDPAIVISADKELARPSTVAAPAKATPSNAAGAAPAPSSTTLPSGVTAVAVLVEPSTSIFAQYGDSLYAGSLMPPDFNGKQRKYREYRTMIRDGIKRGINFGGHYAIVTFGCGMECLMGYIIDLRTGDVYDLPLVGSDTPDLAIAAKRNSSLLIERYRVFDSKSVRYVACEQDVAAWEDGQAKWLSKTRMPLGTDAHGNDERCPDYSPDVERPLPSGLVPSSATTAHGGVGE